MRTITPTISQMRMLASISGKQWMMLESEIPHFALSALDATERTERLDVDIEDFFQLRPDMEIGTDGIARIVIQNTLMDRVPKIYEKLGLVTTYDTIRNDIANAIDSDASGILFVIDSPGGAVMGCGECAKIILDLELPSVAFTSGLMTSAAYKLAAGTDGIVATESAVVGNIGTILAWQDCSEMWANMGVEFKALTSEGASLKSTFHLEPNEEQVAFLQEGLDEMGKQFRDHVTEGRTIAGATLDAEVWRAGWYSGQRAGDLGLIDDIGDEDDARNRLLGIIDEP